MSTGVVVFAHGSSVASANDAVRRVAAEAGRRGGFDLLETAFLEGAPPSLAEAVETLIRRGASRIVVAPYFLTLGLHLQRDLPRLIGEIASAHPGVEMVVTEPLDGHPALAEILVERATKAM